MYIYTYIDLGKLINLYSSYIIHILYMDDFDENW